MEKISVLLAICAGNSPVTGEFPAQRPVTRSFDVFFDLRLNKRLSKQSWGWWSETLSSPLWRHSKVFLLSDFMWTGKYYAFFILSLCFLDIGVYKCLNVFNLTNINGLFTIHSDGYHLRDLSRLIQKYQHFYVRFQIIHVFGAKSLNVLPIDIIWKNLIVYINLRKTHKGMVFQRCRWSLGKVICLINSFACALIEYLINVATCSRQFVLSL